MKEGYLQLKIAELNDKCKQIDQMIAMEKKKIVTLEHSVGGLKELIKKLKDLENFKDTIFKQIKEQNKEILEDEINLISEKVSIKIQKVVKEKTRDMEKTLNYIKERENRSDQQTEILNDINKKLDYLLKHNDFLMMKLVNKAILSDREVTEMDKRSSKQ